MRRICLVSLVRISKLDTNHFNRLLHLTSHDPNFRVVIS